MVAAALSCGVVVTDGRHLLIGHATHSPRWDIPKGLAEPDEAAETAARRELQEETGLVAAGTPFTALGRRPYLPGKDLALFLWQVAAMPDPATLVCRSVFVSRGHTLPEFDRFACPGWEVALPMLGKAMRAVLATVAEGRFGL